MSSRTDRASGASIPRGPYALATAALLLVGAALRIALCWANPPENAFDDFISPIFLLLRDGALPSKYACAECFQPPVLYVLAAAPAKLLLLAGASEFTVTAALTWMNCAVGIGTLLLLQRVLARLPLSDFGRLLALAAACLLPRHIYMSAMFTNDGLATFFSAGSAWFMLRALDGRRWVDLLGVAVTTSLAVFTKYTALPLLPMLAVAFWVAGRHVARRGLLTVAVPVFLLLLTMGLNYREYGVALPNNSGLHTLSPGGESMRVQLLSFAPWQYVLRPVIGNGQVSSVWTVAHASMWFDIEARFFMLLGDQAWWYALYDDLVAGRPTAAGFPPGAAQTLRLGSALQIVGLAALALGAAGAWATFRRRVDVKIAAPFVLLAVASAALVGLHARNMPEWNMPAWSGMKASYLLPSLPAVAFLVGLGGDQLGSAGRRVTVGAVVLAACLLIAHVLIIVRA